MNRIWFRKFGWCHYPRTWQGFLITLFVAAFLVNTFLAVDRDSHSVTDTLYGIFPFWVTTFLLYEWIASKKDS